MKTRMITWAVGAVVGGLAATAADAGTFKSIAIDGSFGDWADVPAAATDPVEPSAFIDFTEVKVANDATNLYIKLTYGAPVNPQAGSGVFTAIDSDNNVATGFNIFGLNAVGSNFGFQNDFPFTQTASTFNSGGAFANATYAAAPYGTAGTVEQEISIPLSASQVDASAGGYTGPIFPGSFTLLFYTTNAPEDVIGPIAYTVALVPEPASLAVLGVGGLALVGRGRRRRRA
jgi:hypothetical protein